MRISFIVNSKIKKLQPLLADIAKNRKALPGETEIFMTEYQGHATKIAEKESHRSDLVLAVGGDGTLNEVVNGIMGAGIKAEERPALALIPKGTANDFARIQKVSKNILSLSQAIKNNKFIEIDIGEVRMRESKEQIQYFINVADSGMGGEVVKRLEASLFRKIPSSRLRFSLAILTTFLSYKRKKVEVLLDDKTMIEGRILTLVAANSSSFGSGLIVAPDAKIDDGKFQVVLGDLSLFGYLTGIGNLLKGKRLRSKGVKYYNASKVKVNGPRNLYTQIDGELAGAGDIEIKCLPRAIRFLVPDRKQ